MAIAQGQLDCRPAHNKPLDVVDMIGSIGKMQVMVKESCCASDEVIPERCGVQVGRPTQKLRKFRERDTLRRIRSFELTLT